MLRTFCWEDASKEASASRFRNQTFNSSRESIYKAKRYQKFGRYTPSNQLLASDMEEDESRDKSERSKVALDVWLGTISDVMGIGSGADEEVYLHMTGA